MNVYSKEGKPLIRCCPKFITVPKTNYRQQIGIKKWDKEYFKDNNREKNYHEISASKGCTGD